MAFPVTQKTTTLLLQNLTVITNANTPISSQYTIYANGIGQTYWGQSISPVIVSSLRHSTLERYIRLSTTLDHVYNELSTTIVTNFSSVASTTNQLSTYLGSIDTNLYSSFSSLHVHNSTLYGEITTLSTLVDVDYNGLCSELKRTAYMSFVSTIHYSESTILGISTQSTFYNALNDVTSTIELGLSSISSALYTQNTSTYFSLYSQFDSAIQSSIVSTTQFVLGGLSTVTYGNELSSFSSIVTAQLLSTSDGLYNYITTNDQFLYSTLDTTSSILDSTLITIDRYGDVLQNYIDLSTNLYSTTYIWISSFVGDSQSSQDIQYVTTLSVITDDLNSLLSSYSIYSSFMYTNPSTITFQSTIITINEYGTNSTLSTVVFLSTILFNIFSSLNSTITQNTSDCIVLNAQVSSINISSVVVGMYSTFLQFEDTTAILLETYSSIAQTLEQTYFANAYSNAYNNVLSTLIVSSLNRIQTIDLFSTNSVGILDFVNYRNFNVNIYEITDNISSPYSLIHNSNSLTDLDYREGTLFINVSTIGYTYSTNNGMLAFDVNRAGFPTTFNESLYPYIGNSDYTLQYTYTINSKVVYANCINTYPRLDVFNLHVVTSTSVYFTSQTDINHWTPAALDYYSQPGISLDYHDYPLPNYFLRGQTIDVEWSNYTFFPFSDIGSNNYNPQVNIDIYLNGSVFQSFGPFPLNISSATIQVPYISTQMVQYNSDGTYTNLDNPVVSSQIRAYVVGKPLSASETTIYI